MQSCKRGNPCDGMDLSEKVYTYNIPDSNRLKIPYTGTDTLVFVSNANDTVMYVGSGKNSQYSVFTSNINPNPDPDCPRIEKKYFENFRIGFIINKETYKWISYNVYLPSPNDISSIQNASNIEITEHVSQDIYRIIAHTNFESLNNRKGFDDSLFINGVYKKGYYIDSNRDVLYNNAEGLLKFKDINNLVWRKILY